MKAQKNIHSETLTDNKISSKALPQAIELEEAILGAMINESSATDLVLGILTSESFYKEANQKIFNAIIELKNKFENIDLLTISQRLRSMGEIEFIGGNQYLTKISNKYTYGFNTESHARIVLEMAMKRELIALSTNVINLSYGERTDAFDILNQFLNGIERIKQKVFNSSQKTNLSLSRDAIKILGNPSESKLMTSGLPFLDSHLKLRKNQGKLIYIGARPSVGKSALITAMMKGMAKQGVPIGCFSLEMSAQDIFNRMVVSELEGLYTNDSYIPEDVPKENLIKVQNAISRIMDLPITYNDNPHSIEEICSMARLWKSKYNIEAIFIDFIQKIDTEFKDTMKAITYCSNQLQKLKKDLNIPIICISSLNREAEKRNGQPSIADFRGSGDIESDADVVLMLWRPEDNNLEDIQLKIGEKKTSVSTKKLMIGNFAKNRNGKKDIIVWYHDLPTNNFFHEPPFISSNFEAFQKPIANEEEEYEF